MSMGHPLGPCTSIEEDGVTEVGMELDPVQRVLGPAVAETERWEGGREGGERGRDGERKRKGENHKPG